MEKSNEKTKLTKDERYSFCLNIIFWGALWGIFEATIGHLLHTVSFAHGWIIWYPAACFFMSCVYFKTQRIYSCFYIGLLCAAIKLLNLFLPVRVDKVLNPAISILFESLFFYAVLLIVNRLHKKPKKNLFIKALTALAMSTLWRSAYIIYLAYWVPAWIKDISVISTIDKFIDFFAVQNIVNGATVFIGYILINYIPSFIQQTEKRISAVSHGLSAKSIAIIKSCAAALILCADIWLCLTL